MSRQRIERTVSEDGTVHEKVYKITPGFFSDSEELVREITTKKESAEGSTSDSSNDSFLPLLIIGLLLLVALSQVGGGNY